MLHIHKIQELPITAISSPKIHCINIANDASVTDSPVDVGTFSTDTSINVSDSTRPVTTDINCMELLLNYTYASASLPKSILCIQALYAWYTLFDTVNWKNYTNGSSVTITVPDITAITSTTPTSYSGSIMYNNNITIQPKSSSTPSSKLNTQKAFNTSFPTIYELMTYYIPDTVFTAANFNPFIARRIIHTHLIMFNFNCALTNTSTNNALLQGLFKLYESANQNIVESRDGALIKIIEAGQNRAALYNTYQGTITDNNNKVTALKDKFQLIRMR
jgi:hypothetical protein